MIIVTAASLVSASPAGSIAAPSTLANFEHSGTSICTKCEIPEATEFDPKRFSRAVANAAISDLKNVLSRKKNNTLRPDDLKAAVSSNQILLAHLDEIGFYEYIDSRMAAFRERIVEHVATEDDVTAVRNGLAKNGVFRTQDEVRRALQRSASEKSAALDYISANGSRSLQVALVQMLSDASGRFQAKSEGRRVRLASVAFAPPDLTFCETLNLIAAGYGLACAVSLGSCLPCCFAAAVAALEAAICEALME